MVTRLINVVSILVVTLAATVIVWGLVADDRDDTRSGPAIAQVSPQFLKAAGVGPRIGRDDAPVVLVLYSDYRCSFCREFENTLRTVRMRYPEHLAVVVKSFVPLDTSEGTRLSLAAECAHEQGVFGAFHSAAMQVVEGQQGGPVWAVAADAIAVPDRAADDWRASAVGYRRHLRRDPSEPEARYLFRMSVARFPARCSRKVRIATRIDVSDRRAP